MQNEVNQEQSKQNEVDGMKEGADYLLFRDTSLSRRRS